MSQRIVLNRLLITGKLNDTTPSCVVMEILQAHNISMVKSINNLSEMITQISNIERYRPNIVEGDMSNRNLSLIATFVNCKSSTWTKSSLLKAYDHLINFDRDEIKNIVYGQKTYNDLNVYNACMLYSLCLKNGIKTDWTTTPEMMLFSIQQLSIKTSQLRGQLSSLIEKLNKVDLVNLMNQIQVKNLDLIDDEVIGIKNEVQQPLLEIDTQELKSVMDKYQNTKYLLKHVNPTSHNEAIILASLLYNLNLTESLVPLDEFREIRKVRNLNLYIPIDKTFKSRYVRNPEWYDLTLFWEPKLSFIYDDEGLKKLCLHEGFDQEDFRQYGYDSLLHISRISQNIFMGKNVYSDEDMTPIMLHDISELNNYECITLGNIETKELITYSIDELANFFMETKDYKNPSKVKEMLEKRVTKKIKMYAYKIQHTKMIQAINVVENWRKYSSEHSEKLRFIYLKNNSIVDILYKVLECGMYMRGWKVTSNSYPLKESNTLGVENALVKIESNVYESITQIFEKVETYSDHEKRVLDDLPLLKISDKSFIVTPDPDDGRSILERLKFVINGDKHKTMKSCIRLTSNIVLVSVYFYLLSLGLPEPFSVNDLDHIT